jgi:hypothetical protein
MTEDISDYFAPGNQGVFVPLTFARPGALGFEMEKYRCEIISINRDSKLVQIKFFELIKEEEK